MSWPNPRKWNSTEEGETPAHVQLTKSLSARLPRDLDPSTVEGSPRQERNAQASLFLGGGGLPHCVAYGMWDLITLTRPGIEYGPSAVKAPSPLDCQKIPPQGPLSNLQLLTYTFTAHSSSSRSSKEQGLCLLTAGLNFLVAQRCSSWCFEYKNI